ncbi:hypothetical protein SmJEL517_g04859 [Synchytrium microbalum]|uniref:Splicing factor Cactin n=1 Tax=Synchytrium microbalum TaxID=1806994 RepID=A0A507C325_9FUNG|nr:uncharacterized protein SmJEL517_g04859 [Synchytrium microbalum]TPX31913.1 hypothetical protein SmJEL517_g04859 [Synchytrium microbalum]
MSGRDRDRYDDDRRSRYSSSRMDAYDERGDRNNSSSDKRKRERDVSPTSDKEEDRGRSHKDSSSSKKSKKKRNRSTSEEHRLKKEERKKLKEEYQLQKESQFAEQMGVNLGYDNKDNPFGDSNLGSKFVWFKKREKEAKQGMTSDERSRRDVDKTREKQTELERLTKRRAEREIEMQLREQEQTRMARDAERAQLGDWEEREKDFHLSQAKTRAQIRIKEGRAKPIDVLAMNISLASDSEIAEEFDALGLEPDADEPYKIFDNLNKKEVEDLHTDIQLYLELEKNAENQAFWQAMMVICDDELSKARGTTRQTIDKNVEAEINNMLSNKTPTQLSALQRQVEDTLAKGGTIEVEYWEAVLKAIIVNRSKTKLSDIHYAMLLKRREQLRKRQLEQAEEVRAELAKNRRTFRESLVSSGLNNSNNDDKEGDDDEEQTVAAASSSSNVRIQQAIEDEEDDANLNEEYNPRMSPPPHELSRDDRQLPVYTPEQDAQELHEARQRVLNNHKQVIPLSSVLKMAKPVERPNMSAEELFVAKASEAMESDEVAFGTSDEVDLSTQAYTWQDKYRPRKPRYFNRVQAGFEWNKYNQTHYDPDNPPPKVVQGYKFNIFYPDLIDRGKAPTYKIERDAGWPDTALIRFIAGPPYEDIAFRIVNREWEHSHKKGFKSSFDRGVLQLHFNFKRAYYRR